MYTVDFETEGIDGNPSVTPPPPVGVSIKHDHHESCYYAFGHPEQNNCVEDTARAALAKVWDSGEPLCFQNSKFDLSVAEHYWGLELPPWQRVHDTQFLIYLFDPHARTFALKPSAERILSVAPEERDELMEWVLANVRGTSQAKSSPHYWGAHIHRAPGDLVGRYANGDTDRTYALYQHLSDWVRSNDVTPAYDRERELMPILLGAERHGVPCDLPRLQADLEVYETAYARVDDEIRALLKADVNVGSSKELVPAILAAGLADETTWPRTPTGKFSTAQSALQSAVEHPALVPLLAYRGALKTCLTTFMRPWEHMASYYGGRLHAEWHQTRGEAKKGGTKTGRMSCSNPNLTNVANEFAVPIPEGYPELPLMRDYLIPEEGHRWLKRDYSSQEVRVLAHFEDGSLMRKYQENPNLDPHQWAAEMIREQSGHSMPRVAVKRIVFSILYGTGNSSLAAELGVDLGTAALFKRLYMDNMPDVRELVQDIRARAKAGLPVRTVGGRLIYCEPPGYSKKFKRHMTFEYKVLNHLIQGSAADITKQGIINHHNARGSSFYMAAVHDEMNISAPVEQEDHYMSVLAHEMQRVPLDVPLTTDGYRGNTWRDADEHKEAV